MPFLLMYPYMHDGVSVVTWKGYKAAAGLPEDTYMISQSVQAGARASLIACFGILIRISRLRKPLQARDIGREEILQRVCQAIGRCLPHFKMSFFGSLSRSILEEFPLLFLLLVPQIMNQLGGFRIVLDGLHPTAEIQRVCVRSEPWKGQCGRETDRERNEKFHLGLHPRKLLDTFQWIERDYGKGIYSKMYAV